MTTELEIDPDEIVHQPTDSYVRSTNIWEFMQEHGIDTYDELIERTTEDLEGLEASGVEWFWDEVVDSLDIEFYEEYDAVRDNSDGPQFSDWYPGGTINIAHNVVDKHADRQNAQRNTVATIWEGEDGAVRTVTYQELYRRANKVANALEERGIGTGDTVGLYMPMVPEVASLLYGIFKVGAIAVPIFSGFGTDATATRIDDSACTVLFTGDGFLRRGSEVFLKTNADQAIEAADIDVESVIVYDRLGASDPDSTVEVPMDDDRDEWWDEAVETQSDEYETKRLDSNQESMLLYSSGTTGKPKGIVHTHAGPLVQAAKEIYFGFDHQESDRFFWVSDIGWMMGPWTLIGNHSLGGTVFIYEGAPDHPDPGRFWDMIDRHELSVFGISPTAIRALRKEGPEWIDQYDLSSLRFLGSTGEPWDHESWMWFYEKVGGSEIPIINISGGTEIMGCFLMPMPIQSLKPGTLGGPGLGMAIDIVDRDGESVVDEHERGYLVARDSCPSMTKSLWAGDDRYLDEYWSTWDDMWDHGDWAQKDEEGLWFLHGRADDALNVAGRKVGPAEVEAAAIEHEAVNQASAIGVPDETTGTAVVLYVIPEEGYDPDDDLRADIAAVVGEEMGKPFRPREIHFVEEFPMTQSGKIVRRAIEATYVGESLGDLSSIENPDAIDEIRKATESN